MTLLSADSKTSQKARRFLGSFIFINYFKQTKYHTIQLTLIISLVSVLAAFTIG